MEKSIFVLSAVSVPKKMMFRCDKQCSEKSLSNWPLASVVVDEGELCQKCFNESVQRKRRKTLSYVQWRKKQSKQVSRAGRRRKAGRNARPVAAVIASQRILGASKMLP